MQKDWGKGFDVDVVFVQKDWHDRDINNCQRCFFVG
jgi:hypothetical protein